MTWSWVGLVFVVLFFVYVLVERIMRHKEEMRIIELEEKNND